jgi:hypothetical protein
MQLNKTTRWICPTCSHKNDLHVTLETPETLVLYCDSESGGCGNRHVIDLILSISAKASIVKG